MDKGRRVYQPNTFPSVKSFMWWSHNSNRAYHEARYECYSQGHDGLDAIIRNNHHRSTNTTSKFWDHTLVHTLQAFFLQHLFCAVQRRFVDTVFWSFFGLEHYPTPHRVERVVERHHSITSHLGSHKCCDHSEGALVLFVWVHRHDLRKSAELSSSVNER